MLDSAEKWDDSLYSKVQSIYTVSYTKENTQGDTHESSLRHIERKGPTRAEQQETCITLQASPARSE